MESVFPADSAMVFVVDTYNSEQVENFRTLAGFFPDFTEEGTSFSFLEYYFPFASMDALDEELSEFLQKPFKIGLVVREEVVSSSTVFRSSMEVDFVLVIQSEAADVIENLLMEIVEEEDVFDFEEKNRVKYWYYAEAEGAIVKYGDIIFAAGTDRGVKETVERLNNGEIVFEKEHDDVEYLAYVYTKDFEDAGVSGLGRYSDFVDDGVMYFIAESDGIRIESKMEFSGDESDLEKLIGYVDYDFGLADKIGGDGVFFYSEHANLLIYIDMFTELLPDGMGLELPAAFVGMTKDKFRELLDSPFALIVSATDRNIPAVGIYIDMSDEKTEIARDAVEFLDAYLEEVVSEFDLIMGIAGEELGDDVLKMEKVEMEGEFLSKVVFAAGDFWGERFEGLSDLELYYGVTFDDVLVIALHPNFEESYGKNTISENEIFEKISERVPVTGEAAFYFDFDLFSEVMEKILEFEGEAVDGDFTGDIFELMVKPFLMPLKFAVGSSYYRDGYLWLEVFVAMEEAEIEMPEVVEEEEEDPEDDGLIRR